MKDTQDSSPVVETGKEAVAEAIDVAYQRDIQRKRKPGPPRPNRALDLLERNIDLISRQLDHYETKLYAGIELTAAEEKRMITLTETLRKNEVSRIQTTAKQNESKKSDANLAKDMVLAGVPKRDVLELYANNPAVADALRDL